MASVVDVEVRVHVLDREKAALVGTELILARIAHVLQVALVRYGSAHSLWPSVGTIVDAKQVSWPCLRLWYLA